jgi:hypothetical protein
MEYSISHQVTQAPSPTGPSFPQQQQPQYGQNQLGPPQHGQNQPQYQS